MGWRTASVQIVAGIAIALFVIAVPLTGIRMLILARRTGGLPERLMGTGLVLIGAVGYPGGLVSGMGRVPVGEVDVALWAGSTVGTQIGLVLVFAFTWKVFRPAERWAAALTAAGAVVLVASLLWSLRVLAATDPSAPSALATRGPNALFLVASSACFAWTGIEGALQYRGARRRLALGLADPVVVNRFLLWAVFGALASAINGASAVLMVSGQSMNSSPEGLLFMGVLGAGGALTMYLAFLPPAGYLRWLRASAASA